MIYKETKYSYQDVTMVPAVISDIKSRTECNPFMSDGMLPIFASPMSTITNVENIDIWKRNKITPIIPRNIGANNEENLTRNMINRLNVIRHYMDDGTWVALSLNEFKYVFVDLQYYKDVAHTPAANKTYRICVDLANGHMKYLYELINQAKEVSRKFNYELIVMTGNIANPATYKWICENAEVDYIRLSIGSGSVCITSSNSSIHYPIVSLIDECNTIKHTLSQDIEKKYKSFPKLIADGGIRGYADVIKAIGLGADYVMVGGLFTSLLESAADCALECYNSHYNYSCNNGVINDGIFDILNLWQVPTEEWEPDNDELETKKRKFISDMKSIVKESYGMSTKKAQVLINPKAKTKTSEGCTKNIIVKETVHQWSDNMISYMKSAMSYTNRRNLYNFTGSVDFVVNSNAAIFAVNK